MNCIRRQIEREYFYRDQAIGVRVKRTKHRAEGTGADLMEHAKRTEGIGVRGTGSVRLQ
jgi:hypothetical protein